MMVISVLLSAVARKRHKPRGMNVIADEGFRLSVRCFPAVASRLRSNPATDRLADSSRRRQPEQYGAARRAFWPAWRSLLEPSVPT